MKKNDKLVVLLGVIVLIIASIGVYVWVPEEEGLGISEAKDFVTITGKMANEEDMPSAVIVSGSDPFYALVATPLAINYDEECNQHVLPLLVSNDVYHPEDYVQSVIDDLNLNQKTKLLVDGSKDAKEASLEIASDYWEDSEAAIIVQYNRDGYNLSLSAIPFASYLRIPVIVTDEIDDDVKKVLNELGVEYTMVFGEDIEGYGDVLRFEDTDQIVDASIKIVEEKFKKADPFFEIDYITVTNPIDAYKPKVIGEPEKFYLGPEKVKSITMNRQNTIKYLLDFLSVGLETTFTMPDYKYALIEIDGENHNPEGVDDYGDFVSFSLDPVDGEGGNLAEISTTHGIPERDNNGNIVRDIVHNEIVVYDYGGKELSLTAKGSWTLLDEGTISAEITVSEIENPYYEMMKGLSSTAPYLTSYRKGIIFAKPDFVFAANDEAINSKGETSPGFFLPGRNPGLVELSNMHIYENIHQPLNELLAQLAGLELEKNSDLEVLTDYYREDPVYIALVGGSTALPRFLYQNEVEPIGDIDGDGVDDTVAISFGGGGTNSDNIYGNIDPAPLTDNEWWGNTANDVYREKNSGYPYVENIVGRITGRDASDASALITRTVFYDDILENMQEATWKENFGNLNGGGLDFRKPLWVHLFSKLPGTKQIANLMYQVSFGLLDLSVGPWKSDTGFGVITAQSVEQEIGLDLDFNVLTAIDTAAMSDGFSDNALDEMKKTTLWNKLTFSKSKVKDLAGEGVVVGQDILENSNFLWVTGHGCPFNFGMDGLDLVAAGYDGILLNAPNLMQTLYKKLISPYFVVGFWGPGGDLGKVGEYNARSVSGMDFGPSFMWLESCFCGKITGMYPATNVGQSFLTSGMNALVASTTGSNIPGGYLDPKDHLWDTVFSTNRARRNAENAAEDGDFPEFHFGSKIYDYTCDNLEKDVSIGQAFRDARNSYLPDDADWELWWSPPLSATSSAGGEVALGPHLSAKFTTYHEYVLYGDPAFNPYMPGE